MLNFSNTDDSLEALYGVGYQTGPNLCTELEKVFQEVIDYKKSLSGSTAKDRSKQVINYFKNTAAKKVLTVIQQYTGLTLDMQMYRSFTCNFAVSWYFSKDWTLKDWMTIVKISEKYCGSISKKRYDELASLYKNIKTQEDLEKMSREVLQDKGALSIAMHEKHGLNGKLFFCPYTAFLVEETYEEHVVPLTAKEIAAIITHECGHVIGFCVHMIDICYKKEILYNWSKKYFMEAPPEVKKRIALSVAKKYFPEKVQKIMDKLEEFKKHHTPKSASLIVEVIYSVFILFFRAYFGIFYLGILCVFKALAVVLYAPIEHYFSYSPDKKSDYYENTSVGGYFDEELADEYVSKFGYTGPLTTALDKLYKWGRYYGGYTNAKGISLYTRLLPWLASTLFTGYGEDYIHPDIFKREENAIMDIIKAFKNDNCPPELLDEYYREYRAIKTFSDNENKTFERKWMIVNKAIERTFDYIINTPYESLYSARFKQEYETLFRQVQQLSNNQLYALAYGLKQAGENNETNHN